MWFETPQERKEYNLACDNDRMLGSGGNISNLHPIKARDFLQIDFS